MSIIAIEDRIEYWKTCSEYDFKTAQSMLKEKRFLYVGFCCYLAVEKIFTAYYWKKIKTEPPFTHNLNLLSSLTGLSNIFADDQKQFIDELMPLNIKALYPDDKERISKILNAN
ncbi:MAG: HEPN domain-containing protein [Ignavibacteria bacterium]|nr:MAG: HEPN domain-containing protein [Ignavibacteria bacterium]KAF0157445.1 MAG: HEPN domain-containing protein [Ignavibacteria bacterium]